MTGELSEFNIEAIETLQFALSSFSQQTSALSSKQRGSEILLLLDEYRSHIEAKWGPGSFIEWPPCQDFVTLNIIFLLIAELSSIFSTYKLIINMGQKTI